MIVFHPIRTSDVTEYAYMEALLKTTFPPEEYRDLDELKRYTDQNGLFKNLLIYDDTKVIGFITYWQFNLFYYVEHLAINPQLRNEGYGEKVLKHLQAILQRPIVLEVEYPTDDLSTRRIKFYERNGFVLWKANYVQPPYKKGYPPLPMYLMVYGSLNEQAHYQEIKQALYRTVYNAEIE